MAIKLDRYHRDYLLWFYPLIILGLTIFAIKRDVQYREYSLPVDPKIDTTITRSTQTIMFYNLSKQENIDSIPVFYPAKNND